MLLVVVVGVEDGDLAVVRVHVWHEWKQPRIVELLGILVRTVLTRAW